MSLTDILSHKYANYRSYATDIAKTNFHALALLLLALNYVYRLLNLCVRIMEDCID
jgi:hypothetical protein